MTTKTPFASGNESDLATGYRRLIISERRSRTQFWEAAYGCSWLETLPRVDVLLIRYCEAARGLAQTGIDQSEYLSMAHQDSTGRTCTEDRQEVVGCGA